MKRIVEMFMRGDKRPEPPTPLWAMLAFLSILPYIALPLTGLAQELKEGYHATKGHPEVTGLRWENFNSITGASISSSLWASGVNASIPGLGVIYTLPNVSRNSDPNLAEYPNSFPIDGGIEKAFITAQADVPISGSSWGLVFSYNCSVVTDPSEFTILNQRRYKDFSVQGETFYEYYPNKTGPNNAYIRVDIANETHAANYKVAAEEAYSIWPPRNLIQDGNTTSEVYLDDKLSNFTGYPYGYFWDYPEGYYPGMDEPSLYEAIYWQGIDTKVATNVTYNLTLAGNLTQLFGTDPFTKGEASAVGMELSAIGIRCLSSSAVGIATIDGQDSTYNNFVPGDTPIPDLDSTAMPRLQEMAPYVIIAGSIINVDGTGPSEWEHNIFRSISSPVALVQNVTTKSELNGTIEVDSEEEQIQLAYLQADDVKRSFLHTYPAYINEMMFNGGNGYSNQSGIQGITYRNENVTAFSKRKIFETGDIGFWIPGGILVVWCAGSIILTVMYGFRRRWASDLDGYSMFRFGADMAERVRDRPEFGLNMGYEECTVLREIPGLIGDANPNFEPGHISLVGGRESIADKSKRYM